ncbi:MAG: hypothetical protein P1U56_10020 [Saprospiraceae bacterium]|nr:hypothetical protein [Saprospiraceae bacterium]
MNKQNILIGIIGILLLLNIGLVSALFMGKRAGNHPQPRNDQHANKIIKERFDFTDEQMATFLASKNKHRTSMEEIKPALNAMSSTYYMQSTSSMQKDSLLSEINLLTNNIYEANHLHFQEIKAICQPNQMAELDQFIKHLIGPKRPKPPRSKQRKE